VIGRRLACALPLALAACAPAPGPVAGTNALPAASTNTAPPPPPPPAPARVSAAEAWAAGTTAPLATSQETVVAPTAIFRVELPGRLADARLTLLDQADALVAGAGERTVTEATTLTFRPEAPLAPAGRYRLRLDGAATRELHAADGTTALPVEWPVVVAGEAPAEKARPAARKRRK
jgi:hypothetical protein